MSNQTKHKTMTTTYMVTIQDAMSAVERGETVYWQSSIYTLRKDKQGDWWVDCRSGFVCPLNGHNPKDFYVMHGEDHAKFSAPKLA